MKGIERIIKNLHVLVYPDLSFDEMVSKHSTLTSEGHDVIILNGSEDNEGLRNLNVKEYRLVEETNAAFDQVLTECMTRYSQIVLHNDPSSVEDEVEDVVVNLVTEEGGEVSDDLVEHEHEDGTIHSHKGGEEEHSHEEFLNEDSKEDDEDGDAPDSSNSNDWPNPWVRPT